MIRITLVPGPTVSFESAAALVSAIMLPEVPRPGDKLRLANGDTWTVDSVLWEQDSRTVTLVVSL